MFICDRDMKMYFITGMIDRQSSNKNTRINHWDTCQITIFPENPRVPMTERVMGREVHPVVLYRIGNPSLPWQKIIGWSSVHLWIFKFLRIAWQDWRSDREEMDEISQSKCLFQNVLPEGLEVRLSDRLAPNRLWSWLVKKVSFIPHKSLIHWVLVKVVL